MPPSPFLLQYLPNSKTCQSSPTSSNDLVKAVDKLLNEIGPKFAKVSAEIFTKSEQILYSLRLQGIARC